MRICDAKAIIVTLLGMRELQPVILTLIYDDQTPSKVTRPYRESGHDCHHNQLANM